MQHRTEALQGQTSRGKQQEPPEVGGKGILLGGVQRISFVPASARERWGLLVPTSWCLWPQYSSVQCGNKRRSQPSLPAAPIEAEAVGSGTTLQPAAGQQAPQGGAGAQIATAPKVEALSAWPAPRAPGYLLMPMGSMPTGLWGLPGHLQETSDQATAWPAALQVPQGVGGCRARRQGDLL